MEKIFIDIILVLGTSTFALIIMFIMWFITDKLEGKIKEYKGSKYLDNNINQINKLIKKINREGKQIQAKGKYLVLDDVLEVELSDKKIR